MMGFVYLEQDMFSVYFVILILAIGHDFEIIEKMEPENVAILINTTRQYLGESTNVSLMPYTTREHGHLTTEDEVTFMDTEYVNELNGGDTFQRFSTQGETIKESNANWAEFEFGDMHFKICDQFKLCRSRCRSTIQVNANRMAYFSEEFEHEKYYFQDNECKTEKWTSSEHIHVTRQQRKVYVSKKATREKHFSNSQNTEELQFLTAQIRSDGHNQENGLAESDSVIELNEYQCSQYSISCYCDEYCLLYGDCCVDIFQFLFELEESTDWYGLISTLRSSLHLEMQFQDFGVFTKTRPANANKIIHNFILQFASCEINYVGSPMLMISRCPALFHDGLFVRECENSHTPLLPPVTAVLPDGEVTFRNVFCAQCHGIARTSLKIWSTSTNCGNTLTETILQTLTISNLNNLINNYTCILRFNVPIGSCRPRYCKPHLSMTDENKYLVSLNVQKRLCSETDGLLCFMYELPGDNYTNPHCRRCIDPANTSPGPRQVTDICSTTYNNSAGGSSGGGISSLLLILDITGTYSRASDHLVAYLCQDDEVYDALTTECKTLFCPFDLIPYRGKCVDSKNAYFAPAYSQIFQYGWNEVHFFISMIYWNNDAVCDNISTIFDHFLSENQRITSLRFHKQNEDSVLTDDNCYKILENNQSKVQVQINLTISLNQEVKKNIVLLEDLTKQARFLFLFFGGSFSTQILITNLVLSQAQCTDNDVITQRMDFRLVEHEDVTYALFNSTKNGIYYPLNNIGFQIAVKANSKITDQHITNIVFICQRSKLFSRTNCSVVHYDLNETRFYGSQIEVIKSNQFYNEGDFEVQGNTVFICSNFEFKVKNVAHKKHAVYGIITCVFTSISIFFLFIMIIIYCLFPELRTLPGKMTASLALTMLLTFISNVLTFADLQHNYICPALAALNHVVTLAHFGWMSAIAVNMALTFGHHARTLIKPVHDRKLFLRYNFIVWGLSIFLVTSSVILDFAHRLTSTTSGAIIGTNTTNHTFTHTQAPVTSLPAHSSTTETPDFPRYGKPHCTWFSGPLWAKLVFIIVPYFTTFIINIIGFIITLIGIQNSSKLSKKVGKKPSERTRCLIYIKLSTAMGFSWITSTLVNIFPDNAVLQCIYVSLVLLQGVLLFLAFMGNKRVYALITKKVNFKIREQSPSRNIFTLVDSKY